jgi:hypothetical protein
MDAKDGGFSTVLAERRAVEERGEQEPLTTPTAALNDIKATGEAEIWRRIYALETGQALLHARASRVLWAPYVACVGPTGTRVAITARSSAVKLLFPRSP